MEVTDVAARLGISRSKVYELCTQRKLGHLRIGGRIVIEERHVEAFRQACEVEPLENKPAERETRRGRVRIPDAIGAWKRQRQQGQ